MATDNPIVEYREIQGYPGYRVGDDGSVWTEWRTCPNGRFRSTWRKMKTPLGTRGYPRLNLTSSIDGKLKAFRLHRLVLEAFNGPCPEGMEGRHLNGIKTDCSVANLAWGTQEQNRQDNHVLGVYAGGSKHTQAKLTEDDVRAIRIRRAAGESIKSLSLDYHVNASNISMIARRKSWKHVD